MQISRGKTLNLFLATAFFFVLTGCERKTTVTLQGEEQPTFVLSGSGRLGELLITKPAQEQTNNSLDAKNIIWRITATSMPGERVETLHSVTYGTVPRGYNQTIPVGERPPKLQPGKRYGYLFVTADAPHAAGYFEIRDGKVVMVEGP